MVPTRADPCVRVWESERGGKGVSVGPADWSWSRFLSVFACIVTHTVCEETTLAAVSWGIQPLQWQWGEVQLCKGHQGAVGLLYTNP